MMKKKKKKNSMKMAFPHSFTKCVIISIFNHLSPSNAFACVSVQSLFTYHVRCVSHFIRTQGLDYGLITNVNSPKSENWLPIAEKLPDS